MSSHRLNILISRHVNQWFHHVYRDDESPATYIQAINTAILQYLEVRKLSLTISQKEFRKYMCEFLCTYYIAKKRNTAWSGPLSEAPRPNGWLQAHELEWQEYLRFHHLTSDFWGNLWERFPEAIWESRIQGWRDCYEYIVSHYIIVQPNALANSSGIEDYTSEEESYIRYNDYED